MNIDKLSNGNLEMTADANEIKEIRDILTTQDEVGNTMIGLESEFISAYLGCDPMGDGVSYEQVAPEEVGALTSAPIISDGENVYGYMQYQVSNFLEELANGNTIVWKRG